MPFTIVASREDSASVNIRDRLLEAAAWDDEGTFAGLPLRRASKAAAWMAEIPGFHVHRERLDQDLAAVGVPCDMLVFVSRHASAAGQDAFTVHPLGNYGDADVGGEPGVLDPAAPLWMSEALRRLFVRTREASTGLPVTFEATHHGPGLDVPAWFIEIGARDERWADPALARIVADVVLDLAASPPRDAGRPIVIGLGGGHYAPRHTDLARRGTADVGHMVPAHHLKALRRTEGLVDHLVERSGGATHWHLDLKGTSASAWADVTAALGEHGLEPLEAGP